MTDPPQEYVEPSDASGSAPEDHVEPEANAVASGEQGASQAEPDATGEAQDQPDVSDAAQPRKRRKRVTRSFPASSFVEALPLAAAIQKHAAGAKVRRLTLFEQMGRSADSSAARQLIINSFQYGLTTGSYNAEFLELTEDGALASSDDGDSRAVVSARFRLAIQHVGAFSALYEAHKGNRLPSTQVLQDYVVDNELAVNDAAEECVATFMANATYLGLLRTYAGAERLLDVQLVLEELDTGVPRDPDLEVADPAPAELPVGPVRPPARKPDTKEARAPKSPVCFVITPIGASDSEQRKHANLVLNSIIGPALQGLDFELVRADQISKPGMITKQVIEYLVRAELVIADLSFGNPNVFYELALRNAARLPVVQIVRAGDALPFDVGQFRTIQMDMSSIYTLVPALESYRTEIRRQARSTLEDEGLVDTPLTTFYPKFWDEVSERIALE